MLTQPVPENKTSCKEHSCHNFGLCTSISPHFTLVLTFEWLTSLKPHSLSLCFAKNLQPRFGNHSLQNHGLPDMTLRNSVRQILLECINSGSFLSASRLLSCTSSKQDCSHYESAIEFKDFAEVSGLVMNISKHAHDPQANKPTSTAKPQERGHSRPITSRRCGTRTEAHQETSAETCTPLYELDQLSRLMPTYISSGHDIE